MTRKELVKSREYWIAQIQLDLFELIENYRKKNDLNKTQLAAQLGVTKSYITQILNGDFDHKVSKLVELSLAFGKVPVLQFIDVDQYIENNKQPTEDLLRKSRLPRSKNTLPKMKSGNKKNILRKLAPTEI